MKFVRHKMVGECLELYKLHSNPEAYDLAVMQSRWPTGHTTGTG